MGPADDHALNFLSDRGPSPGFTFCTGPLLQALAMLLRLMLGFSQPAGGPIVWFIPAGRNPQSTRRISTIMSSRIPSPVLDSSRGRRRGPGRTSRPRRGRRSGVWILAAVLVVAAIALVFQAEPNARPSLLPEEPLLNIAHRGASGHVPENTLESFTRALEMGAHMLEMDLQLTADGHVIIMHDETVDRTTDGTGAVADFTLAQIKALDAGYNFEVDGEFPFRGQGYEVPTLEEVLSNFGDRYLLLELKAGGEPLVEAAVQAIQAHDVEDRVQVASFDGQMLRSFRRRMPGVVTSFAQDEAIKFVALHFVGLHRWYSPPAPIMQLPEYYGRIRILTPRLIRAADRMNLEVHAWTINDSETMVKLRDMGVRALISDYPDRVGLVPPGG